MAAIEWTDDMSVSIPEIDAEHKRLIKMFNNLDEAVRSGRGKGAVGNILAELLIYASVHFKHEETMMLEANYEGFSEHLQLHGKFVETTSRMKSDYDSGREGVCEEALAFLSDWMVNHMMIEDKKYAAHLAPTA